MNVPVQFLPYMKYVPTAALAAGLLFDIFTLRRPDTLFENVFIIGYLVISALVMFALQARIHKNNENKRLLLLGVLQFSFGNLASALMVLYARSGTFAGGAIFIGILALLFLGNEVLKNNYARTHLRVVIWFVLLLTYSTLIVPVLFNSISAFIFLASVAFALCAIAVLILILSRISHSNFEKHRKNITASIVTVTLIFSGMYFTNLIPPVPLALKHIGIYHFVERIGENYSVALETPPWYAFWRDTSSTFNYTQGDHMYCFSSVFAPNNLQTQIYHHWERYDVLREDWITVSEIAFPISGGREKGFRGFSLTTQAQEGKWRCNVETARGNLIGRTSFEVHLGTPELQEAQL